MIVTIIEFIAQRGRGTCVKSRSYAANDQVCGSSESGLLVASASVLKLPASEIRNG